MQLVRVAAMVEVVRQGVPPAERAAVVGRVVAALTDPMRRAVAAAVTASVNPTATPTTIVDEASVGLNFTEEA